MRNFFIALALLLGFTMATKAQVTMREMLKTMPDTLVPFLPENACLDFIDFIDSSMKAEVSNRLEGKSELLKLTDTYATLSLTQASSLDMRLLDCEEMVDSTHQILCLVRTYGTDIRESTLEFYSSAWRKLPIADRVILPADMHYLVLGEQESTLTIVPECRLDAPANEEQKELAKASRILKWNRKRFNEY